MDHDEGAGSRPTLALGLATTVAVASVAMAIWAWSTHDSRPTTLPAVESHNLSTDQAACLDAAIVMRRAGASGLTLQLGKYQTLDPAAGTDLRTEIVALDGIAARHPEAAGDLMRSLAEIVDEGSVVLNARDPVAYRAAVTAWAAASSGARDHCLELADFDVEALQIRQSGR